MDAGNPYNLHHVNVPKASVTKAVTRKILLKTLH